MQNAFELGLLLLVTLALKHSLLEHEQNSCLWSRIGDLSRLSLFNKHSTKTCPALRKLLVTVWDSKALELQLTSCLSIALFFSGVHVPF